MDELIQRTKHLLAQGKAFIENSEEKDLEVKPAPNKWSKKEILGHLIDSAINNLQRFTEIHFEAKPYKIRKYKQEELVRANQYNAAESAEILSLWLALNNRIIYVFSLQNESSLAYPIEVGEGKEVDLRFLMEDYVEHLNHHLKQIIDP